MFHSRQPHAARSRFRGSFFMLLRNVSVVVLATFLVAGVLLAVTTLSTNISTDGTLSVTGRATTSASLVVGTTQPGPWDLGAGDLFIGNEASTTGNLAVGAGSSTNDDSLFFDSVSSEALTWLDGRTEFTFTDDLRIQGNATSTGYFVIGAVNPDRNLNAGDLWVGATASSTNLVVSLAATTSDSLVIGTSQPGPWNLGQGDLFVGNEATTTGNLAVGAGSGTNDDSLFFDSVSSEYLSWLDGRTEFSLSDDLLVNGNASTTGYFVVGTNNPTSNLAAGSLWVGGTASTTNLIVSGSATTTGQRLSIGHSTQTANSTTTVTFGSYEATGSNQGVCFKIRQGTAFIYCIADAVNNFKCSTATCE
mgnify:CR=1 FL=1